MSTKRIDIQDGSDRVEGAAGPLKVSLDETPWDVRRRLFAGELEKQLELDQDKLALAAGEEQKTDAEEKL